MGVMPLAGRCAGSAAASARLTIITLVRCGCWRRLSTIGLVDRAAGLLVLLYA